METNNFGIYDTSSKSIVSNRTSTTHHIKASKGDISSIAIDTGGTHSYYPSTTITSVWNTKDEIVDTLDKKIDDKIEEELSKRTGIEPILKSLNSILDKLDKIDKKYLDQAMHQELIEIMDEIKHIEKSDNNGT